MARKKDKEIFQFSKDSKEFKNKFNIQTTVSQVNLNRSVILWFKEKFDIDIIETLKSMEQFAYHTELEDADSEELEDYFLDFKD